MYSLATPKQTGNLHFAFEATEPPGGGPPLHTRTYEEEIFFVLEGEITFWIDGEVIIASRRHGVRAAWRAPLFQPA